MSGRPIRCLLNIGAKTQFGNPGRKLCGARAKRTGFPCQQPAMLNGRCRLHGGKTPKHEDRKLPQTEAKMWKSLQRLARKEIRLYEAQLRKERPTIDWRLEKALRDAGLFYKVQNEADRDILRNAFALYSKGRTPWITWWQTLEFLGIE